MVIERIDAAHAAKRSSSSLGAVDLDVADPSGCCRSGNLRRIASVGGAEDRAAQVDDAAHPSRGTAAPRRRRRTPRAYMQPVEAVADADDVPAADCAPTRVTARMTAFKPGASPPPVLTAMRRIGVGEGEDTTRCYASYGLGRPGEAEQCDTRSRYGRRRVELPAVTDDLDRAAYDLAEVRDCASSPARSPTPMVAEVHRRLYAAADDDLVVRRLASRFGHGQPCRWQQHPVCGTC